MLWKILKISLPSVLALLVASLLTTRTFHVEIVIPAPPEDIWTVLMDTDSYPDWNPTVIQVDGQYEVGAELPTKVMDPVGKVLEMTNTVKTLTPNRELRQSGGIVGLITYDHQWLLEPVELGTKVTQHEVDRGAFLWFWNSDWIEPAYSRANEALSRRVANLTE